MTLQQLEYIVSLDTYRSFVAAAEHCCITQPTLTMQVKKLENEIGVQIFNRTKKPLQPTKAGQEIISKSRRILREVNQLKDMVSSEKESLRGIFRVGVIPTIAPYLFPLFLPEFAKDNPQTELKIQELQTQEIIRGLKDDTLDIGILVTPLEERSIREVVLYNEPFLLYHPSDHPIGSKLKVTPQLLDMHDLLVLNEGHCFRNQILNICNRSKKNDEINGFDYQSGSIETLKKLVKKGMGYTLVPQLAVSEEPDFSHVKHFEQPEPVREVSIVVHHSFSKELFIEKLRKHILSSIPDHLVKNKNYVRVKWRR